MPAANASFNGDFGLINVYGVPKPGYRALQLMHEAGSDRVNTTSVGTGSCSDTIGVLALRNGSQMMVIVYSQVARGLPIQDSCDVTLLLNAATRPSHSTLRRIDADHANPRKRWLELGAPQWPSPTQNEDILNASKMVAEPAPFTAAMGAAERGSAWSLDLKVPAQGVVGVSFTCEV